MNRRTAVAALLAGGLASACAFLEGALEMTFGAGRVPEIEVATTLPTLDQMGIDMDPQGGTPGVPESLDALTLAHVRGALRILGACSRSTADAPADETATPPGDGKDVRVLDCDAERCPGDCPDGATGLRLRVALPANLVSATQSARIRDSLSTVSPDSILQFRIRTYALDVLEAGPGVSVDAWVASQEDAAAAPVDGTRLTDWMSWMELRLADDTGDETVIVRREWLDSISPSTPQRFDIDADSGFFRQMKSKVLAGEAVDATFVLDAVIPPENLYRFPLGSAIVGFRAQPEFVVSVLRATLSSL